MAAAAPSDPPATFRLFVVYNTNGGNFVTARTREIPVGTNTGAIAELLRAQFWPEAEAVTLHAGNDQDPYDAGTVLRDAASAAELGDLTVVAKITFPASYFEH